MGHRLQTKVNQDAVTVARAIRRTVYIWRRNRPTVASFVGPTGAGKTELAKQLPFEKPKSIIRLMSISQRPQCVSLNWLVQMAGVITITVILWQNVFAVNFTQSSLTKWKGRPSSDHPLLQVLDDGRLTDVGNLSTSRTRLSPSKRWLNVKPTWQEDAINQNHDRLEPYLRPEFLNHQCHWITRAKIFLRLLIWYIDVNKTLLRKNDLAEFTAKEYMTEEEDEDGVRPPVGSWTTNVTNTDFHYNLEQPKQTWAIASVDREKDTRRKENADKQDWRIV